MWPFNGKNKKESEVLLPYYLVDMNKVKTVAQLKDIVRITHYHMTGKLDPEIKFGEERLKDFPSLKNVVTKVGEEDE